MNRIKGAAKPTDDIARGKEDLPTPGKRKRRDVLPPSTPSESEDFQQDTTPPSARKRKTRGRNDDFLDVSEGVRTKKRGLAPNNEDPFFLDSCRGMPSVALQGGGPRIRRNVSSENVDV